MGLFDIFSSDSSSPFDVSDTLSGFVSDASSLFDGSSGGDISTPGFGTPSYSGVPVSYPAPQAVPTMGAVGPAMSAAGALVGRSMRNFPALANAIAGLRARGIRATVESLWQMLKRFGPNALVAGGFLTAAAISDLMYYKSTHKRRRMNPSNTKALRRSLTRLRSFDRLAMRVKHQLGSACHRGSRRARFIPVKKCA